MPFSQFFNWILEDQAKSERANSEGQKSVPWTTFDIPKGKKTKTYKPKDTVVKF